MSFRQQEEALLIFRTLWKVWTIEVISTPRGYEGRRVQGQPRVYGKGEDTEAAQW